LVVEVYMKRATLRALSGEARVTKVHRKHEVADQRTVIHIDWVGLWQLASYPAISVASVPRYQQFSDVADKALMS